MGYPGVLGDDLRLKVANAACTGETSASLIDEAAQSNGCESGLGNRTAGYRARYPLHVRYARSQLAYALSYLHSHHDVRLVSLMIGANDYFLCAVTSSDGCKRHSEIRAMAARVQTRVRTILWAIRIKAHYMGQLVIVNYYSLDYSSSVYDAAARMLNHNQDSAARPFGVEIADGYGAFKVAARHFGGSPCRAGLLTRVGGGCGEHPSRVGQRLLAHAVKQAIKLA